MDVACRPAVLIDVRRNRSRVDARAIQCLGAVLLTLLTSAQAAITGQVMRDEAN